MDLRTAPPWAPDLPGIHGPPDPVDDPSAVQVDHALDKSAAENVKNLIAQQWNYTYSNQYGSPEYSVPCLEGLIEAGGIVYACPPCAQVRGYEEDDFIEGVVVAGAPAMLMKIKDGASTLCF